MKLDLDLNVIEELALSKDDLIHQYCAKLILRVRQLEHDLTDPNYLYAGTRICRQALVVRHQEMQKIREQVKLLQQEIAKGKLQLDEATKLAEDRKHPRDLHDRS